MSEREFDEYYEAFMDFYRPEGASRRPVSTEYFTSTFDLDGRVLDLCCGGGFHAFALADAGLDVIGVDVQARMVEAAREHAADERTDAVFVQGDATNLAFRENAFDHALVLGNSIPLFDTFALESLGREVARTLEPDGSLIVAYFDMVGMWVSGTYRRTLAEPVGGDNVFSFHKNYDADDGFVTRTFYNFDRGESFELDLFPWAPWMVEYVMANAGFAEQRVLRPAQDAAVQEFRLAAD